MTDVGLDADGDVEIEDGDLVQIEDADVVAQRLRLALRTVLGEWYLDSSFGVDYFGRVLVKAPNRSLVETTFRNAILGVEGVRSLRRFRSDFDKATRKFTVRFTVDTDFGVVEGEV